jgi:hypothetical protein
VRAACLAVPGSDTRSTRPATTRRYGVKTLPAVREALEQRAWDEARQQIPLVAQTLERYAAEIERAASALAP